MKDNAPFFELSLPADLRSVVIALSAVGTLLEQLKYSAEQKEQLILAVEEACSNVITHAYEPEEEGRFVVSAHLESTAVVISIQDFGLPYDPFKAPLYDPAQPGSKGLGSFLMSAFADQVRFRSLGREGKVFDIIKRLPTHALESLLAKEKAAARAEAMQLAAEDVEVRLFRPEDAGQIACCAYRTYGYSYLGEHLYLPDRLIEMNAQGQLLSAVIAGPDGTIYGHVALIFHAGSAAPESGQAFVLPQARSSGAFKRMKVLLLNEAKERRLPGVWSEAVTIHPFTQRGNIALGACETGVILGIIPADIRFKQIAKQLESRQSFMLFYLKLQEGLRSEACLPVQHREMLGKIYLRLGIELDLIAPAAAPAAEKTSFTTRVAYSYGIGWITIETAGADLQERIRDHVLQLAARELKLIIIDLPINDPASSLHVAKLEALGFFFSGVIPGLLNGKDALRLQYLNNVPLNPEEIATYSEFSKEILAYVLDCRAKAKNFTEEAL